MSFQKSKSRSDLLFYFCFGFEVLDRGRVNDIITKNNSALFGSCWTLIEH